MKYICIIRLKSQEAGLVVVEFGLRTKAKVTIRWYRCSNITADSARAKHSHPPYIGRTQLSSLEASFASDPRLVALVHALAARVMSEREQSQPRPEEPVTSIENDGAISDEQWAAMMDLTMAIYDFREPE